MKYLWCFVRCPGIVSSMDWIKETRTEARVGCIHFFAVFAIFHLIDWRREWESNEKTINRILSKLYGSLHTFAHGLTCIFGTFASACVERLIGSEFWIFSKRACSPSGVERKKINENYYKTEWHKRNGIHLKKILAMFGRGSGIFRVPCCDVDGIFSETFVAPLAWVGVVAF